MGIVRFVFAKCGVGFVATRGRSEGCVLVFRFALQQEKYNIPYPTTQPPLNAVNMCNKCEQVCPPWWYAHFSKPKNNATLITKNKNLFKTKPFLKTNGMRTRCCNTNRASHWLMPPSGWCLPLVCLPLVCLPLVVISGPLDQVNAWKVLPFYSWGSLFLPSMLLRVSFFFFSLWGFFTQVAGARFYDFSLPRHQEHGWNWCCVVILSPNNCVPNYKDTMSWKHWRFSFYCGQSFDLIV